MACNNIIAQVDSSHPLAEYCHNAVVALWSNATLQHAASTAQVGVLLSEAKNSCEMM